MAMTLGEQVKAEKDTGSELAPDDVVNAAIERLQSESRPGDAKDVVAQNSRAAMLAGEAEADTDKLKQAAGVAANDIWTLDNMRKKGLVPADITGHGDMVWFKPIMNDTFCQVRFIKARGLKKGDDFGWTDLQIAYAEVVWHVLKGGKWGLRETVEDENGETQYEDDGVTPQTVPLPLTWESVQRLDMDELITFINAMTDALKGEVKG